MDTDEEEDGGGGSEDGAGGREDGVSAGVDISIDDDTADMVGLVCY